MVLKYWKMMTRSVKSISSRCSVKIYSLINRFLSLLLVASLLISCVPALGVQVQAADTEMYLYNGVELPKLPEWDREEYPYAVIAEVYGFGETCWGLFVIPVRLYWDSVFEYATVYSTCEGYFARCLDGVWGDLEFNDYLISEGDGIYFTWSNFDVLNEDGSIYMAASEPVPVNSAVVSSIGISGSQQIYKGSDASYSVVVIGSGEFDPSVTASVSGNTSSSTGLVQISTSGNVSEYVLFCGSDETADLLTITAFSVQNPSLSDTFNVVVLEDSSGPTTPSDPSLPPDTPPQIQTSFDSQTVYVDLGEEFGLLFWVTGYEDMHLEYYEFGDLVAETDLSYDASSGVLYGGFFVAGETPGSYTEVRIDAYSGDTFIEAFSCTVVCADPPDPDGSDQVIINKIDDLGGDITQIQDHVELVDKKVETILSGGENAPDLTDQSGQISDDIGQIGDYEQSQKDVLDNNMDTIMEKVDFVAIIPALAFVGGYLEKSWESMWPIHLLYMVPLFLGLFFFVCSRFAGNTGIKARKPPNNVLDGQMRLKGF